MLKYNSNKKQPLTRTVGLISLSRFLQTVLLCLDPASCRTRTRTTAHINNPMHLDSSVTSIKLVPRHCASAFSESGNRGHYSGSDQLCTATPAVFDKNPCTWIAKTRAIPSLHRDSFVAYRDSFVAVLASGNAY